MTVYEGDEREDRYGLHPLRFKGVKKLSEVHEWLFNHYQGYKFCIVLDVMGDEFESLGSEILVYFMDELVDEVAYYAGVEVIKK